MARERLLALEPDDLPRRSNGPRLSNAQLFALVVVTFAWLAVLFLPVPAQIQIGVQAAMMLVLSSIFGVSLIRKASGNNGGRDDER